MRVLQEAPLGTQICVKRLSLFAGLTISDCRASDVRSNRIVLGIPSSLNPCSFVDERMRYRPSFLESCFEFESVAIQLAAATAIDGGQHRTTARSESSCEVYVSIMMLFVPALHSS